MDETRDIEIFRLGRHTDRHGQAVEFGQAEAEALIANYDSARDPAPLVIGHPKTEDHAYGWVKNMRLEGDVIVAAVESIPAEFGESVRGKFRRVSASLYKPGEAASPNPAGYYLRHVGLLGAHAPGIKGLKPVEFSETGTGALTEIETDITPAADAPVKIGRAAAPTKGKSVPEKTETETGAVDFAERNRELSERETRIKAREDAAAKREADALHAGHVEFAEGLVKQAKLKPAGKQLVVGVLDALSAPTEGEAGTVEFAETEGGTAAKLDLPSAFRKLFDQAKPMVEFGEAAGTDKTPPKAATGMVMPSGFEVDDGRLELHNAATALMKQDNKLSYADAVTQADAARGAGSSSAG